ncbi:hypothetical protein, partial [Armatimonas sp.]|uniref:hypothetical protein n=1 Tax=Armatimonas sp. TaxID=1872638 RepID=UPI00286BD6F0
MKVVIRPVGRPLPAHLAELLKACQELNTTETKTLAGHLGLSPASVNAYFQRVAEMLDTADRFSSVHQSQRVGYLLRASENMLVNGDFMEGNCSDAPGNSRVQDIKVVRYPLFWVGHSRTLERHPTHHPKRNREDERSPRHP